MSVTEENDGIVTLSGFCIGSDGREHSSEEGIVISDEAASALRELELDDLPDLKRSPISIFRLWMKRYKS